MTTARTRETEVDRAALRDLIRRGGALAGVELVHPMAEAQPPETQQNESGARLEEAEEPAIQPSDSPEEATVTPPIPLEQQLEELKAKLKAAEDDALKNERVARSVRTSNERFKDDNAKLRTSNEKLLNDNRKAGRAVYQQNEEIKRLKRTANEQDGRIANAEQLVEDRTADLGRTEAAEMTKRRAWVQLLGVLCKSTFAGQPLPTRQEIAPLLQAWGIETYSISPSPQGFEALPFASLVGIESADTNCSFRTMIMLAIGRENISIASLVAIRRDMRKFLDLPDHVFAILIRVVGGPLISSSGIVFGYAACLLAEICLNRPDKVLIPRVIKGIFVGRWTDLGRFESACMMRLLLVAKDCYGHPFRNQIEMSESFRVLWHTLDVKATIPTLLDRMFASTKTPDLWQVSRLGSESTSGTSAESRPLAKSTFGLSALILYEAKEGHVFWWPDKDTLCWRGGASCGGRGWTFDFAREGTKTVVRWGGADGPVSIPIVPRSGEALAAFFDYFHKRDLDALRSGALWERYAAFRPDAAARP